MELALKCARCEKVHVGIVAEECMECGSSLRLTKFDPENEKVRKISDIKQFLTETEWILFEQYAYMHQLTPRELIRKCITMYISLEEMMESRQSKEKNRPEAIS